MVNSVRSDMYTLHTLCMCPFFFLIPAAIPTNLYKWKISSLCCAGLCFCTVWLLIILPGVSYLIVLALYPSRHCENSSASQGDSINWQTDSGIATTTLQNMWNKVMAMASSSSTLYHVTIFKPHYFQGLFRLWTFT